MHSQLKDEVEPKECPSWDQSKFFFISPKDRALLNSTWRRDIKNFQVEEIWDIGGADTYADRRNKKIWTGLPGRIQ